MVAENTTTDVLDALINAHPHRIEFYRTRGIVKVFLDQYAAAARDYTHALVEARAARKGRQHLAREEGRANGKKKGKSIATSSALVTTQSGIHMEEIEAIPRQPNSFDLGNEKPQQHSSVLPEAPLPIEPQCLFLRGSSYLMHAVWLIESAALKLEEVGRTPPGDGMELRLCNLSHGKYGGIEVSISLSPLSSQYLVRVADARPSGFARSETPMVPSDPSSERSLTPTERSSEPTSGRRTYTPSLASPSGITRGSSLTSIR